MPIIILRVIIAGAPWPIISSVISVFIAVPSSSVYTIPMVPTAKCSSATAYPGIIASVIASAASVITVIPAPISIHIVVWAIMVPHPNAHYDIGQNHNDLALVSKTIITSSRQVGIKAVCRKMGPAVCIYFVKILISISTRRMIIPAFILQVFEQQGPLRFSCCLETLHLRLRALSKQFQLRSSNLA